LFEVRSNEVFAVFKKAFAPPQGMKPLGFRDELPAPERLVPGANPLFEFLGVLLGVLAIRMRLTGYV
jgi:hypothetical protein